MNFVLKYCTLFRSVTDYSFLEVVTLYFLNSAISQSIYFDIECSTTIENELLKIISIVN